jgi:hypothetical protein
MLSHTSRVTGSFPASRGKPAPDDCLGAGGLKRKSQQPWNETGHGAAILFIARMAFGSEPSL